MKRRLLWGIYILLLFSLLITVFTACASKDSASSGEFSQNASPPQDFDESYDERGHSESEESYGGKEPNIQKIITNASLSLYAEDINQVYKKIAHKTEELNGYIAESYSSDDYKQKQQARMEVKIPAESLDRFLSYVEELGRVRDKSITTQDITEEYYDIQSRLSNAEKQEKQLLEIMEQAVTIEDILRVQESLDLVQERIEAYKGKINLWNHQVDLSTVTLNIESESKLVDGSQDGRKIISLKEIGIGIKKGLTSTFKFTVNALGYLVIIFFYLLIPGSIILGIVLLVVFIVKKCSRKNRKERPSKKAAKSTEKMVPKDEDPDNRADLPSQSTVPDKKAPKKDHQDKKKKK